MASGEEADLFVLLTRKEELLTRDGKRYFRVTFRDARREVSFPIWGDSPLARDCERGWQPGAFYKLRATYRETTFGAQLDIHRIRDVVDADAADGFEPRLCRPQSRIEPRELFQQLIELTGKLEQEQVRTFVIDLLESNREVLLELPAAERLHHAYAGGWLEHTLNVARLVQFMADQYLVEYPDLSPPLDLDLALAGAILHDIGKIRELTISPKGAVTTASGYLLGHIVQGRDMVREAAVGKQLPTDWLLRLEHLILSHQPSEHGAPKEPMTPEALLVKYADDVDAKLYMLQAALRDDAGSGLVTSKNNALGRAVYRGKPVDESNKDGT